MPFFTVALVGTDRLVERIQAARAIMAVALPAAIQSACEDAVAALASQAPRGTGGDGGQPPGNDAPGPLSESFVAEVSGAGVVTRGVVRTTQPTKLRFVRYGTGIYGPSGARIVPRVMQALSWQAADHPVRSVAGMPSNDFVTPLLPMLRDRAAARVNGASQQISATLNGG